MPEFVCLYDYEKRAKSILGKMEAAYLWSGSDDEITLHDNEAAFKRIRLRPRMPHDGADRDLQTSILGHSVSMPIGVAPTGCHGLFHSDGETASAKAACAVDCCYILSTGTTQSVEVVHAAAPGGLKWFQVYIHPDRDITRDNVRRAAKVGFTALVLTADAPIPSKRRGISRNPLVLPPHLTQPMLTPVQNVPFLSLSNEMDPGVTWGDISWLKKESGLPVVIKGILTAEDAELAIQHGADAVYVSNHGGRQLDTVQASIDALPEVVAAAGGRVEVYLDGGIRTGTDVLKALALGARAVFVGRPVVWGLAFKGQKGVEDILLLLKEELSQAMAVSGCRSVCDINSSLLSKPKHMAKM